MLSCWPVARETGALNVVNVKMEVIYVQIVVHLKLTAGRSGRGYDRTNIKVMYSSVRSKLTLRHHQSHELKLTENFWTLLEYETIPMRGVGSKPSEIHYFTI